ncbi:MAG: hypothetical protein KGI63_00145 [Xanthomonadaceae bacterium]|nr:hypothetical protein [Xanthomonadaceae bacterium]
MLRTYASLAIRSEHLLQALLAGQPPQQWRHYPEDDAIDVRGGYQWFYHSHSPEDRPDAMEHGHFHLFARRPLWSRRMQSTHERAFSAITGHPPGKVATRHLLTVGVDARGIPVSLFTVNSWVTGDLMLSAPFTAHLLANMRLNTGHSHIDAVLECVVALCADEIHEVLAARDAALAGRLARNILRDESLELLSEKAIDMDEIIARKA